MTNASPHTQLALFFWKQKTKKVSRSEKASSHPQRCHQCNKPTSARWSTDLSKPSPRKGAEPFRLCRGRSLSQSCSQRHGGDIPTAAFDGQQVVDAVVSEELLRGGCGAARQGGGPRFAAGPSHYVCQLIVPHGGPRHTLVRFATHCVLCDKGGMIFLRFLDLNHHQHLPTPCEGVLKGPVIQSNFQKSNSFLCCSAL